MYLSSHFVNVFILCSPLALCLQHNSSVARLITNISHNGSISFYEKIYQYPTHLLLTVIFVLSISVHLDVEFNSLFLILETAVINEKS